MKVQFSVELVAHKNDEKCVLYCCGLVAQLVEPPAHNRLVECSSHSESTIMKFFVQV